MCAVCRILVALLFPVVALSFTSATASNGATRTGQLFVNGDVIPSTIAVCGSTGRVGRRVVFELLDRGYAIVRNAEKAENVLPCQDPKVTVVKCDLSSEQDIAASIQGCDAVVWCATGFSDAEDGFIQKLKSLFGIALEPKKSIDSVGIPAIANCMLNASKTELSSPRLIMLSSAGTSRPSWSEEKKAKFIRCSDIPIVRLNPFGILDIKADSEKKLRETGVSYCIVRPCGLNDDWPSGCRPVFSQGDVAVGRINRKDVARILVDVASSPEACGKTFEVFSLNGYAPPTSIVPLLDKLRDDSEVISEETLENTYNLVQQLLPGEQQDSASLAMGQTY
eukprot:CAMPEP_0113661064 /NCGR_PEP_ID=MMETSP0017_2-20120614/33231_1 /TAXON_ID=2856 /ORGANISM="Cylindrotheca closterium" /LENGTH=336 /DNA_ID=CAMNT_0000575735 /DNA_START=24 /DNA_END=1032 /DNA_ORIENTATION=- /assembly_acc=CAM_ASM_000147